jgi:hypothetical protein
MKNDVRNPKHKRQGDVGFAQIDKMPELSGLKKVSPRNGLLILAEGEATGHHHSIVMEPAIQDDVEMFEAPGGTLYLRNKKPVMVGHQEHDTITLPAGVHQIEIQVEYDPEGDRRVAD